jgi:hypothetical protein
MLNHRLKGKWSLRRRQGFHSTLPISFILRRHSTPLFDWYNLSLIFPCTNGEESKKGSQSLRFWRLMPKGERVLAQSKRTAPPPFKNFLIDIFQIGMLIFNWLVFSKLASKYTSNWYILKPSWKLRGEFHSGVVLFESKEKHLKQGEKFQILKMLLTILFIYLWVFAKRLWKDFPKEFAKTKHVVQMWSKILNKKKATMHI